jgi:hypothetical protein
VKEFDGEILFRRNLSPTEKKHLKSIFPDILPRKGKAAHLENSFV